MNDNQRRSAHFLSCLGVLEKIHPIRGGAPESPFTVLEVAPSAAADGHKRVGYTYITNGMSARSQPCKDAWVCLPDVNIEVMIYCRKQSKRAIEILEELANFPFEAKSCLARGQVLPTDDAGELGWAGYALFAPHREDPGFSPLPFEIGGNRVHVLWVYPLLQIEVEFGNKFGGDALERIVREHSAKPFLDLKRKALVSRESFDQKEREIRETAKKSKSTERRKSTAPVEERKSSRKLFGLTSIFSREKSARASGDDAAAQSLPTPGKSTQAASPPSRGKPPAAKPQKAKAVKEKPQKEKPQKEKAAKAKPARGKPAARSEGIPERRPAEAQDLPATFGETRTAVASAAARELESIERLRQLEAEMKDAQSGLRKAREESKAAEAEREESKARAKAFTESLDRVNIELASEESALEDARAALNDAQSKRDDIARELIEVKKESAGLDEKKLDFECEIESAESRRKQIEDCRQSMEQATKDAVAEAEAAEARAADLKKQVEELQRQADEAAQSAVDARIAAEEANLELEKEAGELAGLATRDEELRQSIEQLDKEAGRVAGVLETKQAELRAKDTEITELEKKNAPDTSRHDQLVAQKKQIQGEFEKVDEQLEKIEEKLRAQRSAKTSAAMQEQKLDRQIKDALDTSESAREEHSRLRKHFEKLEAAEMQSARAEADAAAAKVAEMQAALEAAKEEAERKLKEIEVKSKKLHAVSDEDVEARQASKQEASPDAAASEQAKSESAPKKKKKKSVDPAARQRRATARMERLEIIKQSMMNQKEDKE